MKHMLKKLGTLALTFVVMFSMVTTVFAATTGTITLHTGKHNVNGVTFKVYKMMDATITADGTAAAYTIGSDFKEFFVTDASLGSNVTDEQAYKYIKDNVKNADFQKKVKEYVKTKSLSPVATLTGKEGTKTYTTSALDAGYYVIIPSDESFTPMFTTVAKATQDVYLKGKKPDVDKTVNGNDWTSAQVGDTIRFKVESMVPNMTGYTEYHFQLKDTMSSGLTVSANTLKETVMIGDKKLNKDTDYEVTVSQQTITIKIKDFIKYQAQANEAIVFEYDAVLNENAVTAGKENNTANVEYGNDPDSLEQGTTDKVIVRTHTLTITKTNQDESEKLAGAQFKLYKGENTNGDPIKFKDLGNGKYRVATENEVDATDTLESPSTENVKGIITISGLADGKYTLVETKAPDGYNKLDTPTTITITAESTDKGENVTVSGNTVTVKNNKGSLLPETGGMGTVLFTVVGVGGILAVGYSFMKSNKKNRLHEKK
ncbi:SpaH/EbpB family LPXTG-anchored major pilin [Amedibacillus dolichus]|uniref:SpaH/EbpB family LPXTG-anchored major pilin n=1 Tax=Amedibacillus dolichus TaxID=31971 RepID=UPI00241E03C2|nr:SpaH/EbpB family LPXTG-anchored major pilin [Amedibacillus dolichus]